MFCHSSINNVAGAVPHPSQLGLISGVNSANLDLDQCRLCTILNCITLFFKQIEDECILSIIDCQTSSECSVSNSSSHCLFRHARDSKSQELSNV